MGMKTSVFVLTELVDSDLGSEIRSVRVFEDMTTAKAALRKRYDSEMRRAKDIEMLFGGDIAVSGMSARIAWTDGDETQLVITKTSISRKG